MPDRNRFAGVSPPMGGSRDDAPAGRRVGSALCLAALACGLAVAPVASRRTVVARQSPCANAPRLLEQLRARAIEARVDARARLVSEAADHPRRVVDLRLRARAFEGGLRMLVEVTAPPARATTALLVQEAAGIRHYRRAGAPTPGAPSGSAPARAAPGDAATPWPSACLGEEELLNPHYWWSSPAAAGEATVGGRPACVVQTAPDEAASSRYTAVRMWIDPERLAPLAEEKTTREGAVITLTYGGFKERDDVWLPRRVEAVSDALGCRSLLTVSRGTAGATLDEELFDPATFLDKGPPR